MADNDDKTNLALEAANEAFKEHIASLYNVLKAGLKAKDQDAVANMKNGVMLGRQTLAAMRAAITETNPVETT